MEDRKKTLAIFKLILLVLFLVGVPAVLYINFSDTLFSIACAYGDVRPEDIAIQNQLVLGEPLPAGLVIVIP